MIPSSLPAGIPEQGPCTDCTALVSSPGLQARQGVFQQVLSALLGGLEARAVGALPVQAGIEDKAGSPGEPDSAGIAASLQLATKLAEGFDNTAPDSTGGEAGQPVPPQAEVAGQATAFALLGLWQVMPQTAAGAVVLPEPSRDGRHGVAAGQGVAATFAGGRQQLPPSLPAEAADATLPGQVADASGQGDAAAGLSRSITADVTARPVLHTLQPATDPPPALAPERPLESGKTAMAREVLAMQLPLRAQGWDGELAQRIVWMAGRQTQWAEITLNPPNLGNLEVHLSLKGNDVSAYFYSPHAAVREAIDESLSRLREMLAGAGISLGQTQVSQESFGDRRGGDATAMPRPREAGIGPETVLLARSGQGLVDLYV